MIRIGAGMALSLVACQAMLGQATAFVHVNVVDVAAGASLGRPGGNVTGVTHLIAELSGKRLELLRELAPKAVRIGVLVNPNYPAGVAEGRELQARGEALGLTVHVLNAAAESDFAAVFS